MDTAVLKPGAGVTLFHSMSQLKSTEMYLEVLSEALAGDNLASMSRTCLAKMSTVVMLQLTQKMTHQQKQLASLFV